MKFVLSVILVNPGELTDLRQDLSLLPTAVEEILRWSSPVIYFARSVTRDVERGG